MASRSFWVLIVVLVGVSSYYLIRAWRRSAHLSERATWWSAYKQYEGSLEVAKANPVATGAMKPWGLLHEANAALQGVQGNADLAVAKADYAALGHDHSDSLASQGLLPGLGASAVERSLDELTRWEGTQVGLNSLPASSEKERVRLVTDAGVVEIGLYPDRAPEHVKNFLKLAGEHFYEGTRFHRVVHAGIHIVQGGDPNTRSGAKETWGMGGSGDGIPVELNNVAHLRGAVAMAQPGGVADPKSSGCQFYIVTKDSHSLDRRYTVFGQVISGMDIVDRIAARELEPQSERPRDPCVVLKTEVF